MLLKTESKDMSLRISSTGGPVERWQCRDKDIFYPAGFEMVDGSLEPRGGCFVAFPYSGLPPELGNDLPRDGWLKDQDVPLVRGDKPLTAYAEFSLEPKEPHYPHEFHCKLSHKILDPFSFQVNFKWHKLQRRNQSQAFCNPGFHPYFTNLTTCTIRIDKSSIRVEGEGPFGLDVYPVPNNRIIEIDISRIGLIEMQLGGDFSKNSMVYLWSDRQERYICVEPVLLPLDQSWEENNGAISCTFRIFPI